jgi:hypothetical protein
VHTPKNRNVWNYVPPHRGAQLDGGSPGSLSDDQSVDGGWSDRSTLGSTTSGFQYCPEAPYDGRSYVRRDGLWRELFEGTEALDSFNELVQLVVDLEAQVDSLQTTVNNLVIQAEGWDEERVVAIETTQQNILKGDVVLDRVSAKGNITAYVDESS